MNGTRFSAWILGGLAAVLMVVSVVGLVRSGADGDETAGASGPDGVTIVDFAFHPETMNVAVGDTITWTNDDAVTHTVTSLDGGPLDSGDVDSDGEYEATFSEIGTYEYVCTIHPFMEGTVEVTG